MALEGLKRLIENNAFTECTSSADIARKWRIEADRVAQFVGDACDVEKGCRAISAELYRAYKSWAEDAGVRHTVNRNTFTSRLERLGYAKGRGAAGTRMIEGLKPKGHNGQAGAR